MVRLREFTLMEGDLLPELEFTVEDESGNPVDLTGGAALFLMATKPEAIEDDSENVISALATIVDAPNGLVRYSWASGDTDSRGKFLAAFEVTDGTGRRFSVPNDDYIAVVILARLPFGGNVTILAGVGSATGVGLAATAA